LDKKLQPWIDALVAVDNKKKSDKTKLIGLLTSKTPIPRQARLYLADLLGRKQLKNPDHRPPTPLYKYSDRVSNLLRAVEAARYYRKHGETRDGAFEKAARDRKLTPDAVRTAYDGGDSGIRKMKKAKPHLKGSFRR
jgi:hypothetical protein